MTMTVDYRFSTGDKAIAEDIARQYGGEVRALEGPAGGYEVVAVITELPEDDADGDVA